MNDSAPLRILLLEDDPADATLVSRELDRAGITYVLDVVATGPEFQASLSGNIPDIILSDNSIPGYDGMTALRWSLEHAPGVPFVFVSGTIGEEAAIQAMREGAADYVHKDRLSRLGPVLERLRQDHELRLEVAAIREQHVRGQKLSAMGEMAAAVAHDFRNILTAMLGHTELLLLKVPDGDPGRDRIRTILAAGERGVELCAELLSFGRQKSAVPVHFDPVSEIRRTEALFRSMLTRAIELHVEADDDPGLVHADPGQFGQVLMNLLVNARDAMPAGGTVTIAVGRRKLSESETFAASVAVPGEYVEIAVTDTGTGMTEQVRARIFEPYFTTKASDKGSGLGLAIVYGIVRKAAGHLGVISAPGGGSTFRILLPQAGIPVGESVAVTDGAKIGRTVLVADDDRILREQIGQTLELAGFTVLLAGDGAAAQSSVAGHAGPIALLLTDLHMPGMDGWTLAGKVAAMKPDTRILVMTGSPGRAGDPRTPAPHPVIRKPFSPGDLLVRVQEILGPRI